MSKVQVFAKNVKQKAVQKFSRWKTGLEDFGNRGLWSRLRSSLVREADFSALVLSGRAYSKVAYHEQEQVRGARARV